MRCEPILQELAVPTGAVDQAELAEHLAECPSCAESAERSRQLDRIWEATRPTEPVSGVWDRLWADVSRKADARRRQPPILARFWPDAGPRRRQVVALAILAQAAALLIAGVLTMRHGSVAPRVETERPVVVIHHDIVQAGTTLFICLDAQGRRVESESRVITPKQLETADVEDPISLAWDMELINSFEGAE